MTTRLMLMIKSTKIDQSRRAENKDNKCDKSILSDQHKQVITNFEQRFRFSVSSDGNHFENLIFQFSFSHEQILKC